MEFGREPAVLFSASKLDHRPNFSSNQLRTSSETASVMEFGLHNLILAIVLDIADKIYLLEFSDVTYLLAVSLRQISVVICCHLFYFILGYFIFSAVTYSPHHYHRQ